MEVMVFMEEYPIARAYRDVRVGTIAGGTSEIMREILAKMIIDDVRYKKVYNEGKENKQNIESLSARSIIESLPERLKKEKVNGANHTFNFDISGDGGGQFTVEIKDSNCTVSEGLNDSAECTVSSDAKIYCDVELGNLSPESAVMSGQLKISNLMAMMAFSKLFSKIK